MDIKTTSGIDVYSLPECARCGMSDLSPELMDECPIRNFDNNGEICVPELCDAYTEDYDDLK